MVTSSTTSSTNSSTARSGGEGNDLLDLRDTDGSEQDSALDDNSGADPATAKAPESNISSGGDDLSEAPQGRTAAQQPARERIAGCAAAADPLL